MKLQEFIILSICLTFSLPARKDYGLNPIDSVCCSEQSGAYNSGIYPNLFTELLGISEDEVKTKISTLQHSAQKNKNPAPPGSIL